MLPFSSFLLIFRILNAQCTEVKHDINMRHVDWVQGPGNPLNLSGKGGVSEISSDSPECSKLPQPTLRSNRQPSHSAGSAQHTSSQGTISLYWRGAQGNFVLDLTPTLLTGHQTALVSFYHPG